MAQLIFKKESYSGYLDLIIWGLGIEVRDSADQSFKMREELDARQFFHGRLWRWGVVSHDKDGQLVENGHLSATAAGKLSLPTPMNLEELLQP